MLALTHHEHNAPELTLAVLGCGTMGIAILSGILTSLQEMSGPRPLQTPSGRSTPADEVPSRLPSRFIACVRRPESAKRVKQALWEHSSSVKVVQKENVSAVMKSEVIILACKPYMVEDLLNEPGMSKALHGKLLISICAGITVPQIEKILHGAVPEKDPEVDGRCRIVRALPNTASMVRQGMTVVANSNPPLPPQTSSLVTWIFKRIGDVIYLPAENMDASTALAGSGPAFFSLVLEAAVDGAVALGVPRAEAQRMAAQSMKGAAALVASGDHPALLRDRISTPGGCTIEGLLVLEEGRVRSTVAKAVKEAAHVASQLGKGI
ncbi:pyrroline-5-carboxylate reductase [Hypoxylon trugodes]|uniref:pyrroline-5-carboxylate reductase n=1 Tax=Hypoxylon trugodes TaxID=326681 RepID=UPI0021949DEB|nr:pyrroline-5-carboxylate reductase [Hypoxylon trugodes]KAI1384443.1 pyrroline-5-carboxylate reductase [Hypoxylon trugodes]